MKYALVSVSSVLGMALLVSSGAAQGPVIYPGKGQSPEQQNKDKGECHVWAVQQSGFDPAQAQAAPAPAPQGPTGERARGAARGAAVGAVGGAIGGDAGKGAAAGAAAGTVAGGVRKRQNQRQQEAQTEQVQQANSQGLANYNKAVGACLEGRGYTVK
jgi:hypothetical protein